MKPALQPWRPGERVRVRPLGEILTGLDAAGRREGLSFMPEMARLVGEEFRVSHRVRKLCVEGGGMRRFGADDVVVLGEVRCDGADHEGCAKQCLIFWKEAWLERVEGLAEGSTLAGGGGENDLLHGNRGRLMGLLGARVAAEAGRNFPYATKDASGHYRCQSTDLAAATQPLSGWGKLWVGVEDWRAGNYSLRQTAVLLAHAVVFHLRRLLIPSSLPHGSRRATPVLALALQPGEWVQVKGPDEINATLDRRGCNRGLAFTALMLPFCGGRFRVKQRVGRMVLETDGTLRSLRDTVILDGVTCDGHTCVGGCLRNQYHLWREIWLRRVPPAGSRDSAPI